MGLPTTLPGLTGPVLLDWARAVERHGFSTVAVLDRLVYDNFEPIVALAAAAAVTERVRLAATILIAAYRDSPAVLAKQLATVDRLSGGRLVVGVAAGGRADDFTAAGARYARRGRRLDQMITRMRAIWDGDEQPAIGPVPANGSPPVLVGGHSPAAMRRAARYGQGWIAGGSSASGYAALAAQARQLWLDQGRTDRPRMLALAYVCLGPQARERAERYLGAYYGFAGPKAAHVASSALTDPARVRALVADYAEAGCDELLLFPCDADPAQVDLLAAALR